MPRYLIDVPCYVSLYIEADSEEEAKAMAHAADGEVLEIKTRRISGAKYEAYVSDLGTFQIAPFFIQGLLAEERDPEEYWPGDDEDREDDY